MPSSNELPEALNNRLIEALNDREGYKKQQKYL